MKGTFPINKFREQETPFYYYDANLLRDTLNVIRTEAAKYNKFCVHYAIKANANPKVLSRRTGILAYLAGCTQVGCRILAPKYASSAASSK